MSIRRLIAAGASAVVLATALAVPVAAQDADTSDKSICFSNNYAANSWRQAMLRSWEALEQQVEADGVVASADVRTTAQNDATQQQQQISDMILEGCNAIVVNAANPESLNGVVEEACAQDIPVVSWDGIVTAECAYRVGVDFVDMGYQELVFLADKLPEGGKLLEIRGLAGTSIDEQISEGIHKGVAEFPQFEIVGSVNGDWAQDVAQQAVAGILPTLPEDIVGVVTQGGDGYGAAQAFADAGRPRPIIIMGNRQDELAWWKEQKDARRLRDDLALDRPRPRHGRLLGRAAAARRRRGHPARHRRAVPALGPGQLRGSARGDGARRRRDQGVHPRRGAGGHRGATSSDRPVPSGLTGSGDPTSGRVAMTSPSRSAMSGAERVPPATDAGDDTRAPVTHAG